MTIIETKYGRRLATCASSILATAETQRKPLAPIIPMAQAAKMLLEETLGEETLTELEYHFRRIEEFIAQWRPSPNPKKGVLYIQQNWAKSVDTEAQEARKVLGELREGLGGNILGTAKGDQTVKNAENFRKNYAFVVMAVDPDDSELADVLHTIKRASKDCGVHAERVDEAESNDRITDRILESICQAEFVIVDITHPRPNVFYEAGYAQGRDKTPIYIARTSTPLAFDIKDFPIIYFKNMKELEERLTKRLQALGASKGDDLLIIKSLGPEHFQ